MGPVLRQHLASRQGQLTASARLIDEPHRRIAIAKVHRGVQVRPRKPRPADKERRPDLRSQTQLHTKAPPRSKPEPAGNGHSWIRRRTASSWEELNIAGFRGPLRSGARPGTLNQWPPCDARSSSWLTGPAAAGRPTRRPTATPAPTRSATWRARVGGLDAAASRRARARPPDDDRWACRRWPRRAARFGEMREASAGKDTTTGHWEMAGLGLDQRLAHVPAGFPPEMIDPLRAATGPRHARQQDRVGDGDPRRARRRAHGDRRARSSTRRPTRCSRSRRTRRSCRSTSCYRICEAARADRDEHRMARVIARPFVGEPGAFKRTYNRRDYSLPPPDADDARRARGAGLPVGGRRQDLATSSPGAASPRTMHSEGNADGLRADARGAGALRARAAVRQPRRLRHALRPPQRRAGVRARARGVRRLAAAARRRRSRPATSSFITADHGNDPTYARHRPHARVRAAARLRPARVRPARPRRCAAAFCDLGADDRRRRSGIAPLARGASFLADAERA